MLLLSLAGLELLLIFIFFANEKNTFSTLSLVAFGLLVHFFCGVNLIDFVKVNYLTIVLYSVYYVGVGVLWSFPKWYFYLRSVKTIITESRDSYKNERDWLSYNEQRFGGIPPRVGRHKAKIISWIAYWPFSILWTLLDDLLTKIVTEIYNSLSGLYQKISNKMFEGIN